MRKLLVLSILIGLLAAAIGTPAVAAKRKKPVKTTLYFHGNHPVGEVDGVDGSTNGLGTGGFGKMDTKKPTEPAPSSMLVVSYAAGPNTSCAGSPASPVWVGPMRGTITGNVKVTFDAVASPTAAVDVQLFADTVGFACDMKPSATTRVALPPSGKTTATIKNVKVKVAGALMVQITPVLATPNVARVLYDSTNFPSSVTFNCIPASGKKCA